MGDSPVAAIINTSPDVVEMLRFAFERAGFVAVTATTYDLRDGKTDLESFVRQHQPDVIVYDIAPPYDENWRLFQHLRMTPALRDRPVVLTTTNARRVSEAVAESLELHEVVGKPYDLDDIVAAARFAMESRPQQGPA